MSPRKPTDLSSSLVAVKGKATAATDAKEQGLEDISVGTSYLNFRVSVGFKQRFRQRAGAANVKLNELLKQALEAWEEKKGL